MEVEVPPTGYTSVEESINDIEEKLAAKQLEYKNAENELGKIQKQLMDATALNSVLLELHSSYSDLALKQVGIFNRVRSEDLKQHKDVVIKGVFAQTELKFHRIDK
ncbi:hypothetical protein AAKU64_004663 [Undibacterium sp. GrIS 1.8]|uniref:hypothetical protein n=1 Tax=Undibacterium sp. GrIS 1.8 TaxID=3143934 RepID=UPI003398AA29